MAKSIEKLEREIAELQAKRSAAKKELARLEREKKKEDERKAREQEQKDALEFYRRCVAQRVKWEGDEMTVKEYIERFVFTPPPQEVEEEPVEKWGWS